MKTKQQQIDEFLKEPILVGQKVVINGNNSKDLSQEDLVVVHSMDDKNIYFEKYGYRELQSRLITEVKKDVGHIGNNPFKNELRLNLYQIDIDQLMHRAGYDRREKEERTEKAFGVPIPEVCFNPIVVNDKGEEVVYQRGLVWSLEDKQLLIDSIYNNIEIGKFIFRLRSYPWVEKRAKAGKIAGTAFKDVVDGKQRINAILGFYTNQFPDSYGNYFRDLSEKAQRRFTNYSSLSYGELDEKSTDKDVLNVFLSINFAGVQMSKEHISFVKSISL